MERGAGSQLIELPAVLGAAAAVPGARLRRAAGLLVGAGLVGGVGNLAFNVVIARAGGSEAYGVAGVLLALGTVAGFAATGIQYAVARHTVTAAAELGSRERLRQSWSAIVPWLIGCLLFAAASPLVAFYLRLGTPVPVLLADAVFVAALVNAIPVGVLLGEHRYGVIAWAVLAQTGARIAAGVAAVRFTDSTQGALLATLVSVVVVTAAITALLVTGDAVSPAQPAAGRPAGVAADGAKGALGAALLWSLWTLPLLFARHFLPSHTAGNFAAAQLVAGGILFLTAPLVTAFFPSLASSRGSPRVAATGFVATVGIATLAGCGLVLVGPALLQPLYGGQFSVSRGMLATLSLSAAAASCATYLLWHARARHRRVGQVYSALTVALVAELAAGSFLNRSEIELALGPLLGLVLGGITYLLLTRRPPGKEARA